MADAARDPTEAVARPDPDLHVLGGRMPGWRIEFRRTRSSLIGVRRDASGRQILRLHPDICREPDWSVSIYRWLSRPNSRDGHMALDVLLQACRTRRAEQAAASEGAWAAELANLGAGSDRPERLRELAAEVHARWFSELPPPPTSWGRQPPRRRLRHLRFGCYRRREGRIELSPRLARPWIPLVFLAHVIHHELCHHRQSCQPERRRETAHSPRFRAWERGFPGYADALRWERLALPWLLDDTPPPWYRSAGSNACV